MSIEVICGSCQGRLKVEVAGVVVACPHCGVHLTLPAEFDTKSSEPLSAVVRTDSAPAEPAAGDGAAKETVPAPDALRAELNRGDDEVSVFSDTTIVPAESKEEAYAQGDAAPAADVTEETQFDGLPAAVVKTTEDETTVFMVPDEAPESGPLEFPDVTAAAVDADDETTVLIVEPPVAVSDVGITPEDAGRTSNEPAVDAAVAAAGTGQPSEVDAVEPSRGPGVSRLVFVLVLSYASAMTLAFLLVFQQWRSGSSSTLESLPDVVPPTKDGKVLPTRVPEDAPMPPGHTLKLGTSRRFGNVVVTPLKVTRGDLHFAHYEGDSDLRRPAEGPVLKLWLRFENVSEDQTFTPLGKKLVYERSSDASQGIIRANNFVCNKKHKRAGEHLVLHYDLVTEDVWDLEGQFADRILEPGDVIETYLSSEVEGVDALEGNLVWRVQFRKGYHPATYNGVTTLIEVDFHSNEIRNES